MIQSQVFKDAFATIVDKRIDRNKLHYVVDIITTVKPPPLAVRPEKVRPIQG